MSEGLPLLEFDPDPVGMVNPSELHAAQGGDERDHPVVGHFAGSRVSL